MKGHLAALHAGGVELGEHAGREVQAGRGCGHRTFDLGIYGLITFQVALFGIAVEIGRYGQFADGLEYLRKGHAGVVPGETYLVAGAARAEALGGEREAAARYGDFAAEQSLLPLLEVPHKAGPGDLARPCEGFLIVGGRVRLKAEHLDERARMLVEMQAGLYHLRIVENHQRALGYVAGQTAENILARRFSGTVQEELGGVAVGLRILGYPCLGQVVGVVADVYVFRGLGHFFFLLARQSYNFLVISLRVSKKMLSFAL